MVSAQYWTFRGGDEHGVDVGSIAELFYAVVSLRLIALLECRPRRGVNVRTGDKLDIRHSVHGWQYLRRCRSEAKHAHAQFFRSQSVCPFKG